MTRLHANEIAVSVKDAAALVAEFDPALADAPIAPVASPGTDNTLFRIGPDLVLRCPRRPAAVVSLEKECALLPELGGLPLHVPKIIGSGSGNAIFSHPWAIYRWLDGAPARRTDICDDVTEARRLGRFLKALHGKTSGVPPAGAHNHYRGVALRKRHDLTVSAIAGIADLFDATALTNAWERALDAPTYAGPARIVHGDITLGNLLATVGRLTAVIDWGLAGAGDPAVDGMPAWSIFSGPAAAAFRGAMSMDTATEARARGWALSTAAIALDYYRERHAEMTEASCHTITAVLADQPSA